jgi:hypothetical protein
MIRFERGSAVGLADSRRTSGEIITRSGGTVKSLFPMAAIGADARRIAEASAAAWGAIDVALAPVIGARGSAALYKRSLHLARATYPLLADAHNAGSEPGDFSVLRTVLSRQTAADAAAAHDALLRIFHDLLADLVGRSLTRRLLQSAWEPPSSTDGEQDASL